MERDEEEDDERDKAEEDDQFEWWKEEVNDGVEKWTQLEHCGPLFPPEYEPHGVKMKYDGKF